MRTGIASIVSKLVCRPPAFRTPICPTLEQLEDRCVPSANMMMSMGMNMPPMTMPSMNMQTMNMPSSNMQSMGTNTMSGMLNPNTLAAIDQLFMDFNQTLQQVLSSTTTQQFITNELHMIEVVSHDIAQIRMLV